MDFSSADTGRVGEGPTNRREDFTDKLTTWLRAGQSRRESGGKRLMFAHLVCVLKLAANTAPSTRGTGGSE